MNVEVHSHHSQNCQISQQSNHLKLVVVGGVVEEESVDVLAVAAAAAAVVDWVEKHAAAAVHVVEGTCLASLLRPGHV